MKKQNKQDALQRYIEHHRQMTMRHGDTFMKRAIADGEIYTEWFFSSEGNYWSLFFTNSLIELDQYPTLIGQSATLGADSYYIDFADGIVLNFRYWPTDHGNAMETHLGRYDESGIDDDFYAYRFAETDETGEIRQWETLISPECNDFLDTMIGIQDPFMKEPEIHMLAIAKTMQKAEYDLAMADMIHLLQQVS